MAFITPQSRHALMAGTLGALLPCTPLAAQANAATGAQDAPVEQVNATAEPANGMLAMPLEDLLTMETTSVARKRQSVGDAAAAVYVITQEDIARSAATNIPELLRMAPGIEVAQIQNGDVGVTARGFNSPLSSTLLVLVDGRAIYFSSLSGVLWSQQLLPLSEIERIEIVRGPGAALWGSNAVNGVINIISKHASAARGLRLETRLGLREQSVVASYNQRLSDQLSYRLYARGGRDLGMVDAEGQTLTLPTRDLALGARVDYEPDARTAFTLQSDFSAGSSSEVARQLRADVSHPGYQITRFDNRFTNLSVLGRMTHQVSDMANFALQSYVNRTEVHLKGLHGSQTTVDGDLTVHLKPSARHEFNLGIGARLNVTDILGMGSTFRFQDDRFVDRWISGFIQHDFWIVPSVLRLTLGTKLECNGVTGLEFQPSARLLLKPDADHAIWAAVSRSARTPSIYERAADFHMDFVPAGAPANPLPFPLYLNARGNRNLDAEHMTAWELGARGKLGGDWTYDLAAYYNEYAELTGMVLHGVRPLSLAQRVFFQSDPTSLPPFEAVLQFENAESAAIWGVEGKLSGSILPGWRIDLTAAHLGVTDPGQTGYLKTSPRNQFGLRTSADIGENLTLSAQLRHVGRLEAGGIPAYQSLDIRARYQVTPNLDLSLLGKNLLTARHAEFHDPRFPAVPAQVPRTISVQLSSRF